MGGVSRAVVHPSIAKPSLCYAAGIEYVRLITFPQTESGLSGSSGILGDGERVLSSIPPQGSR